MSELLTVADQAVHAASEKLTFTERLLYTGRLLVKQAHETMYLPGYIDPEEAVQYFAPELRSWAKPLYKIAAAGFKEPRHPTKLLLNRVLSLNQTAKDEPETIVFYTAKGKSGHEAF